MSFRSLIPAIPDGPLTTFTLFRYPFRHRFWAFGQMGLPVIDFKKVSGLRFWKMMGSGKNGFSLQPDFSRYALLNVWKSNSAANAFFDSPAISPFRERAEMWTVKLVSTRSQGRWDTESPFLPQSLENTGHLPVAVLTRATIRPQALVDFWRHVPVANKTLNGATDLIFSVGVGEKPFTRQATVSFWKNAKAMEEFAYRQAGHREIVQRTRTKNWYAEDLFARFVPVATEGTYEGRDILADFGRDTV